MGGTIYVAYQQVFGPRDSQHIRIHNSQNVDSALAKGLFQCA